MKKITNRDFWLLFLSSCVVTLTIYTLIAQLAFKITTNPFEHMSVEDEVGQIVVAMEADR